MIKLLRELSWFIKKNWYLYLIVLLCGTAMTFLTLNIQTLSKEFFHYLDFNILTKNKLFSIVIRMILTVSFLYLAVIGKRGFQSFLQNKLNFQLREKFLREILYQDKIFFEKYNSGDLIARATGDIMWVRHASIHSFNDILYDIITIGLTMFFCLNISTRLTFISILPLPLVYIISNVLRPKIRNNWRRVRQEVSKMNDDILEDVSNV